MRNNYKQKLVLIFAIGLSTCVMLAHDVPVHRAITVNAIAYELNNSPAFNNFSNLFPSNLTLSDATNFIVIGSEREDDPPGNQSPDPNDGGGYRSLNHFYDPVYDNYGRGLSDAPFLLIVSGDSRYLMGTNSFAWASISNCVGISTPLYNHPVNTWSWQNARAYEWIGLMAIFIKENSMWKILGF